jgi:hypothetical protein
MGLRQFADQQVLTEWLTTHNAKDSSGNQSRPKGNQFDTEQLKEALGGLSHNFGYGECCGFF